MSSSDFDIDFTDSPSPPMAQSPSLVPSPVPDTADSEVKKAFADLETEGNAISGVCLSNGGFAAVILVCIIGGYILGVLTVYLIRRFKSRRANAMIVPNTAETHAIHVEHKPIVNGQSPV